VLKSLYSACRVSFGWPSVDAYYAGSSSSLSVPNVAVPLLVIQAEDDPIAPVEAIPTDALRQNPNCILVVTPSGGHLGWCSGETGVRGAPWSDGAIVQYLGAVQKLWQGEEFKRRAAHAPVQEEAGVFSVSTSTHQAP